MNYLFTSAGLGTRFKTQGIKPAKPLIKVNGQELLLWAMMTFPINRDNVYIVTLRGDNVKSRIENKIKLLYPNANIHWHELPTVQNGQLCTAVAALETFKIDGPLIIHNCDSSFNGRFIDWSSLLRSCDGLIPYFNSEGEHWSFLEFNSSDESDLRSVCRIAEKKRISEHCSIGTYAFASAREFSDLARRYISQNRPLLGEYYIAPFYNYFIKEGRNVCGVDIEGTKVFGTPEETCQSLHVSYFQLLSENDWRGHQRKTLVVDIDGTLCSEPILGDYALCEPIHSTCKTLRTEHEMGTYIILFTARNMRSLNGNIGLINKYTAPTLYRWLRKHDIPYDELVFGKPWGVGGVSYLDDNALYLDEFTSRQS